MLEKGRSTPMYKRRSPAKMPNNTKKTDLQYMPGLFQF